MRKNSGALYRRTLAVTMLALCCAAILLGGVCAAYREIRAQGFDDYRPPVELTEDGFRFLDFELPF